MIEVGTRITELLKTFLHSRVSSLIIESLLATGGSVQPLRSVLVDSDDHKSVATISVRLS